LHLLSVFGATNRKCEYLNLKKQKTKQQQHSSAKTSFAIEPRAAAAVGQSGLMSLYDAMFSQYGVKIAQVLVTKPDFYNEETRRHLASTVSELISLNIVPIINTNDAVSPPPLADEDLAGVKVNYSFIFDLVDCWNLLNDVLGILSGDKHQR
jgi:glutamate 5-kinase